MKRMYFLLLSAFCSVLAMAQDGSSGGSSVSVTKTTTHTDSATGIPWLWIVIGVVVLILIIALVSGGSNTKIVHKRTIIKE